MKIKKIVVPKEEPKEIIEQAPTVAKEPERPPMFPLYEALKKKPIINTANLKGIREKLRSDSNIDVLDGIKCVEHIFIKMFPNVKGWQ